MIFFFIGFMGSGKSYFAKKMAQNINIPFLDMDDYLEQKMGTTINQIFQQQGEDFFRREEQKVLVDIIKKYQHKNLIIATGGGTPCYFDNMQKMNTAGSTIYFELSEEKIFELLKEQKDQRPLLKNLSEEKLVAFIHQKLSQRKPFYQQAKIVIPEKNLNIEFLKHIIQQYV